jgi:colicin import membrane protein
MPNQQDRDQFAPPRPKGRARSWSLALAAHGLLIAALLWTVRPQGSRRSHGRSRGLEQLRPGFRSRRDTAASRSGAHAGARPGSRAAASSAGARGGTAAASCAGPKAQAHDDDHEAEIALAKKKKQEQLKKEKAEQEAREQRKKSARKKPRRTRPKRKRPKRRSWKSKRLKG